MELVDPNTQTQAQVVWVSEWTWHPTWTSLRWDGWVAPPSFLAEFLCFLREKG